MLCKCRNKLIEKKGKLVCANPHCHWKNWNPIDEKLRDGKEKKNETYHRISLCPCSNYYQHLCISVYD